MSLLALPFGSNEIDQTGEKSEENTVVDFTDRDSSSHIGRILFV